VFNRDRCVPPKDEAEVRAIAVSAGKWKPDPRAEKAGEIAEPDIDAASSWTPTPLDPTALAPPTPPVILTADDGQGAPFYGDKRHLVFGQTESLKTWICAAALVDVVRAGRAALWIDTDGMGRADMAGRLESLGLTEHQMREQVLYVDPERAIDAAGTAALLVTLEQRDVGVCVIDAHDPALEINDLDPNATADILRWTGWSCPPSAVVVSGSHHPLRLSNC